MYLKDGLSNVELDKIINSLVNPLSDLVRTNEKEFKLKPFDLNSKKLIISFLYKNPICLQDHSFLMEKVILFADHRNSFKLYLRIDEFKKYY